MAESICGLSHSVPVRLNGAIRMSLATQLSAEAPRGWGASGIAAARCRGNGGTAAAESRLGGTAAAESRLGGAAAARLPPGGAAAAGLRLGGAAAAGLQPSVEVAGCGA